MRCSHTGLIHGKEYLRRLKFTHLEQEAKRKFLVSITGDEPQRVQPGDNEELGERPKQHAELPFLLQSLLRMLTFGLYCRATERAKEGCAQSDEVGDR